MESLAEDEIYDDEGDSQSNIVVHFNCDGLTSQQSSSYFSTNRQTVIGMHDGGASGAQAPRAQH